MSDRIPPALTAEQWRVIYATMGQNETGFDEHVEMLAAQHNYLGLIALINDVVLPDNDPRKITREVIATLLEAANCLPNVPDDSESVFGVEHYLVRELRAIAAALASYLPPSSTETP